MIPSLASLAMRKHEENLRERARQVEKATTNKSRQLRYEAKEKMNDVVLDTRRKLKSSPEAEMVRRLVEMMRRAEAKLDHCAAELVRNVSAARETISHDLKVDLAQVDIEGAANRKAVLEEHLSFLVTKSQLAAEDNSKRVCAKPDCRKEYDPSKLPNNKRCSFPRCSAVFEDCGCGVSTCNVCDEAVCNRHNRDHDKSCLRNYHRKRLPIVCHMQGRAFCKRKYNCPNCSARRKRYSLPASFYYEQEEG
jgi:hypothetical protein